MRLDKLFRLFPILLVLAFAGCGGKSEKQTGSSADGAKEISIYTMQLKPMYTDYMEGVFAAFEKANPGVKVKWLDFPFQDYETKLLALIRGGQAPDVQNLPVEYMFHLEENDMLLKLDDRISSDVVSRYVDAVVDSGCRIDGSLYGVPWYLATNVYMYNRTILQEAGLDPDKPPANNDELFAMSRQIKEKTGKFGFMMTFSEDGAFKLLLVQEGIPLTNSEGTKAAFNTPEAVKLLADYKKLFDDSIIPRESATAEHRRVIDMYKSGKLAFFLSGPQFLNILKNESPEVYNATGIAPAFPVRGTDKYDTAVQNLCVYAKTPHPKEAIDLALWVTNAENQLAFSKLVTIFPSVKEALKDPYFTQTGEKPEDKARTVAAKQLESAAILVPPLPRMSELNKAMSDMVQGVLLKNVSPEEALGQAEQKWNEILANP